VRGAGTSVPHSRGNVTLRRPGGNPVKNEPRSPEAAGSRAEVVEAAGIEPASEAGPPPASTCLAADRSRSAPGSATGRAWNQSPSRSRPSPGDPVQDQTPDDGAPPEGLASLSPGNALRVYLRSESVVLCVICFVPSVLRDDWNLGMLPTVPRPRRSHVAPTRSLDPHNVPQPPCSVKAGGSGCGISPVHAVMRLGSTHPVATGGARRAHPVPGSLGLPALPPSWLQGLQDTPVTTGCVDPSRTAAWAWQGQPRSRNRCG